jgi:CNT family concentrative nucleoside transporter
MATIAGTMMVLYAAILGEAIPNALGHILTASLINAPGALIVAGLLVPAGRAAAGPPPRIEVRSRSAMDAITRGTLDGIPLLLNIIAMLIVAVALSACATRPWGCCPAWAVKR